MSSTGRALGVLALALLVGGCGDRPLGGIGDLSQRVVHGDSTTTVVTALVDEGQARPIEVRNSRDTQWFNAALGELTSTIPDVVQSRVWERGGQVNRFVQASPSEIALVLPEVRFPAFVPAGVDYITSQLVFDPETGTLDLDTAVAFGLWTTVPYSVSRQAGQVAVLRVAQVGPASGDIGADFDVALVGEGQSLSWRIGGFRYELFCRTGLDDALCTQMAESMRLLRELI